MLREVEVGRLTVGMYVAELDRPWLDTPFPLQGFYVRSQADIEAIEAFCRVVMVDPRRYDRRLAEGHEPAPMRSSAEPIPLRPRRRARRRETLRLRSTQYEDAGSVEDELPAARQALDAGAEAFGNLWDDLIAHRQVRVGAFRSVVDPMVESVLRNKDALVALLRVKHLDRHTHEHCLALAVWGGLLGRQLGLAPEQIKTLALGCSLLDIGKIRVPPEVLHKPGKLDEGEFAEVQAHVQHSLDMVAEMGEACREVIDIIGCHHERMDGSGYPAGLSSDAVPVFARMAGIVDSYDAMISPRVYADTLSSHQALVELQDLSPERFPSELVDQFVQAIGLFPNGCLVELSSGEVGVVFGQNPGRRLRPKVMLILDAEKRKRESLVVVDLKTVSEQEARISRELAQGEYGIDSREYFL
jgi:HD-GYP domain-containing protein (c-di-GMP phosphodiesterase class II)